MGQRRRARRVRPAGALAGDAGPALRDEGFPYRRHGGGCATAVLTVPLVDGGAAAPG